MRRTTFGALVAATLVMGTLQVGMSAAGAEQSALSVTRLAGADRYSTAVEISRWGFQPDYEDEQWAVSVASGANFPDALASGPLAASEEGPLLLVPQDGTIPATVRGELTRLNPYLVNIAGGAGAVSSLVESQLKDFGDGYVYRWAGADRYETAADLASLSGGTGTTVFLATGASFPDALGGSAAAGRLSGALMLTARNALPQATEWELEWGKPAKVVILGGTGVISSAVASQVKSVVPSAEVVRWSGADRYATAAAVSRGTYPQGASTAFLASGENYPDALAGAPVAALNGAPLLLTRRDCMPPSTRSELTRLGVTELVVLGGTGAVSQAAANLTPC
jgi:putative cell wall-binding protein